MTPSNSISLRSVMTWSWVSAATSSTSESMSVSKMTGRGEANTRPKRRAKRRADLILRIVTPYFPLPATGPEGMGSARSHQPMPDEPARRKLEGTGIRLQVGGCHENKNQNTPSRSFYTLSHPKKEGRHPTKEGGPKFLQGLRPDAAGDAGRAPSSIQRQPTWWSRVREPRSGSDPFRHPQG